MPSDCYNLVPVPKADVTVVRPACWGFFCGVIQYTECRRASPALTPPLPPAAHCVKWHSCFFTLPFFCPPLIPLGVSSHQMVPRGHSVCFVLRPLLGFPTWCRVQPHLRVSLHPVSTEITVKVFIILNGLWTLLSSEGQWQSCEDELCEEVPTYAFWYRISIMISPGPTPHSDDNFCLPALTHSLNLCKT